MQAQGGKSGDRPDRAAGAGQSLDQVVAFFRRMGLLGQRLTISHQGQTYRVSCDQRSFHVFRINPQRGMPPGHPGWTVCRLDERGLFEQGPEPGLSQCSLNCDRKLADWLELVERQCRG